MSFAELEVDFVLLQQVAGRLIDRGRVERKKVGQRRDHGLDLLERPQRAWRRVVLRDPFDRAEEPRLVLHDRSAERTAVLRAAEGRLAEPAVRRIGQVVDLYQALIPAVTEHRTV